MEDNEFIFAEIESIADEEGYIEGSLEVPHGNVKDISHSYMSCVGCEEVGAARKSISR